MFKIKNLKLLILFLPSFFCISSCNIKVANINNISFLSSASLSGLILELNNLNPIFNADITLNNKITKSDREGFYEIKSLNPGNYNLTISRLGYETLNLQIDIDGKIKRVFLLKPIQNNNNNQLTSPSPFKPVNPLITNK